jgi:hypothetical protein
MKLQNSRCAVSRAGLQLIAPCTFTHPSCTSNVGPTAINFSRSVDVVRVFVWFLLLETDGSIMSEVFKNLNDLAFLSIICTGKGSSSVEDRM